VSSALTYLYPEDLYQIPATKLVVTVSRPWEKYTSEERALLAKILGSVKLDLASVKIIESRSLSMSDLTAHKAARFLVFGADLSEAKPYENLVAQGFSVIKADDLSALDDAKKKSLWLALKAMFGI
jgi:hypothetical protein